MAMITLTQANRIIEATLAKAREMKLPPMSVAIMEPGGHLKAMAREDGQSFLRARVCQSKAWAALALGVHTRHIAARYEKGGRESGFIASLNDLADGQVTPLPGGLLIRDADGEVIGSVGVSGAASEDDEICAKAGIEAIGLTVNLD